MHSDLTNEDIRDLKFSIDKNKTKITAISIDTSQFKEFPRSDRFPVEVYFRLFAYKYLPSCIDKIIYLDSDTIAINSLSRLYNSNFEDKCFISMPFEYQSLEIQTKQRLGLSSEDIISYSGVLLINLEYLRQVDFDKKMIDFVINHKEKMVTYDEDILNVVFQKHMKFEDYRIYNFGDTHIDYFNKINKFRGIQITLEWVKFNSVILHYFGEVKPWQIRYKGTLGEFYKSAVDKYWSKYDKLKGESQC